MFALMSYEGDKGRTAPENSFVNEKETAFSAEA